MGGDIMDERELKKIEKKLKLAMQLPYEYPYGGTIRSVPKLNFLSLNTGNKLIALADDTYFPPPTAYSLSKVNLTESNVNVAGHSMGAVVRENFVRIILLWNYLSDEDEKIVESLDFPRDVWFSDPIEGYKTLKMVRDYPNNADLAKRFFQPTRQSNGINWVSLVLVEATGQ